MMRTIKRYSNRKLYDTQNKKYITLNEIAKLVRSGVDLRVLDKETEEDLTNITLSQILHEKERAHKGSLPKSFFTNVLQSGNRIRDAVMDRADKLLPGVEEALKNLRLPTRAEFSALQKQMQSLENRLAKLEGKGVAKKKAKKSKKRAKKKS
ncbi:MAG: polyhydroxyalkanoate synthesis regulator DNA-binding domain-containing protein [Planctomycetota bacterium]|jgi:polyhydroxyalkanoate synthesis repressor PhaR|nr:polyhydroxyalkanoate synthesis regulator DNA-binding domain-containing protein [Planctomycetota bacterium]